jgi:hypothetical protein
MVLIFKYIILTETVFFNNMTVNSHFQDLLSSLSKAGLQPGSTPLIPENFKLTTELIISYGGKDVVLGNFLTTTETKDAPAVSFDSEVWSP